MTSFSIKERGKFKYESDATSEKISKILFFWKCKKILAWLLSLGNKHVHEISCKNYLSSKKSAFTCSAFSKKYNFSHNKSLFPQPKYSEELMAATTISEETCCTTHVLLKEQNKKFQASKRLCRIILHSKMLIMPFQHLPSVHLLDWYGK